jgi:allantoinase
MPWDVLIRNGTVVTPESVGPLDLAIEDGQIVDIAAEIHGSSREEIDATGLHIFPGVIDPHVHFNEPGRTDWEGFDTGTAALAAGGGTCFFDMPLNSSPPTLDAECFDLKLAAARANSRTDFALWGGLTPRNLDHMEELAGRGVIGFKAFMSGSGIDDFERADDVTLEQGMRIAASRNLIVAVHAESESLTLQRTADIRGRGGKRWRDYLDSRPIEAELMAIDRAIELARLTRCRLHIVHVSCSAGVQRVDRAARDGVDVTCETCPHYLLLTEDDLLVQGAPAKCAPPVRTSTEVESLWSELSAGRVAFVGSDHSPAPASMKTSDDAFAIWGGIAGVQSTLAAILSREFANSLVDVAQLTAAGVARRFGLARKGRIDQFVDADLALVDLNATYTLTRDMLLDRHKLSPYIGRTFTGLVKRTLVRGHTVFQDGKANSTFRGRLVTPGGARA